MTLSASLLICLILYREGSEMEGPDGDKMVVCGHITHIVWDINKDSCFFPVHPHSHSLCYISHKVDKISFQTKRK